MPLKVRPASGPDETSKDTEVPDIGVVVTAPVEEFVEVSVRLALKVTCAPGFRVEVDGVRVRVYVVVGGGGGGVGTMPAIASPLLSNASQRYAEEHDIEVSTWEKSTFCLFHAVAPPVGFIEVIVSPELSTAAQKVVEGQDMAVGTGLPVVMVTGVQAETPPSGLVET